MSIRPGATEATVAWDIRLEPWAARTGALLRARASYILATGRAPKGGREAGDDLPLPLHIEDAGPNGKRIVISHSNHEDDAVLLREARRAVERLGFEAYVAEEDSRLDEPLHQKILENVLESDGILLLLTRHGMRSLDVREELGYARMKRRMSGGAMKIMPLVAEGVRPTGLLAGAEYRAVDPRSARNIADVVAAVVLDEFFGKPGAAR